MKNLVFSRIFLHCVALGFIVSGLLLSPRPPVRARAGVPTSKQHHKVISRRRRRPIDRWCCFSFPNRTHFIGLRFGFHQGANTVPFPPHGENCTMLAPSSFSESNPLRWASIYFFYNKAGKHNLCLPAFAYSFGFPFLLFEKRYHNGAGARMGSDHTSYGRIANFFQVSFPDVTAVFDIF